MEGSLINRIKTFVTTVGVRQKNRDWSQEGQNQKPRF